MSISDRVVYQLTLRCRQVISIQIKQGTAELSSALDEVALTDTHRTLCAPEVTHTKQSRALPARHTGSSKTSLSTCLKIKN